MAAAIIMPKAGMAMEEGTIVKWLKAEGDAVEQGEPILEILTDKVNMEVEAQVSGTLLKILKAEGEVVPVTKVIGYIGNPGEKIEEAGEDGAGKSATPEATGIQTSEGADLKTTLAADTTNSAAAGAAESAAGTARLTSFSGKIAATPAARRIASEKRIDLGKVKATGVFGEVKARDVLSHKGNVISPLARRVAEANGIDPSSISGSGYNGKVLMKDVASAMSFVAEGADGAQAAAGTQQTVAGMAAAQNGTLAEGQFTPDGKEIQEVVPYSGIRKVIGERMGKSKFTAPHVYFTQKVDLEKLLELRKQINEAQEKKTSVTDYIAKAVIKSLKKYPDMNESLLGDKIVKYKSINLGIAVAAPGGLIVPVIRNANDKSVVELSKEAGALFEKARSGKLMPDEYTGGTFTISNLGMFGIENFTAILNPPEVGILAVSATKDEPVVVTDENGNKSIGIRPMMNITLTVDHRLIDGLLAAQFVTEIKRLLENPIELLV